MGLRRGEHGSGLQPSTGDLPWVCRVPGPLAQAGMGRAFGALDIQNPLPSAAIRGPLRLILAWSIAVSEVNPVLYI